MLDLTLLPDQELELDGFEVAVTIDAGRPGFGTVTTEIRLDGEQVLRYRLERDFMAPGIFTTGWMSPASFDLPAQVEGSSPHYWSQIFRSLVPSEQRAIGERADDPQYRSFRIRIGEFIEQYLDDPDEFGLESGRYIVQREWAGSHQDGTMMVHRGVSLVPAPTP